MASNAIKVDRYLGLFKKPNRFTRGAGAALPEAYKKFWREWKLTEPAAVHYVPEEARWKRNPVTGEVHPVQNVPIPLKYPKEFNDGLWGGETLIQGFKKKEYTRRNPHFWFPQLRRSVVYSEILNCHLSVVVTFRTIQLINDHYGFDHYLLKTPACDLKSKLALKLKRKLLEALQDNCPAYADDRVRKAEVMKKYYGYLSAYTPEEIDWYGLDYDEAVKKYIRMKAQEAVQKIPLKQIYRGELIEKLKAAGINEALKKDSDVSSSGSWLSKINPFTKKET